MAIDKHEIAVLAEDYHNKHRRFEMMRMANTPSDPDEARKAAIKYHIAEAKLTEAYALLSRAKAYRE